MKEREVNYLSELEAKKDEGYRDFLKRIIPEGLPPFGVRMNDVRMVVKSLPSHDPLEGISDDEWYEQRLVRFLAVSRMKMEEEERMRMIEKLLPYLDSWAVCDSFVSSLKSVKKDRERYFSFISDLSENEHPFIRRFVLVMILTYFKGEDFLSRSLSLIREVSAEEYTTQMAKAWALTTLVTHHEEKVLKWYRKEYVGERVHRMLKQKIRESTAVDSSVASRLD